MPFDRDGDGAWDDAECFPLDPDAVAVGNPCSVVGGPASGIDDCGEGSMCFEVDPDLAAGTCVAFCDGEPGNPICNDPLRVCTDLNEHVLSLCLAQCEPWDAATCAGGEGCVPVGAGAFACVRTREAPAGPGEPCRYANDCMPGSACLAPESLSACDPGDASGCCASYCDPTLAKPQCGAGPDECRPISRFIGAWQYAVCAAAEYDELVFIDWIAP